MLRFIVIALALVLFGTVASADPQRKSAEVVADQDQAAPN